MRIAAVVNPRSQNGALGKRWPSLEKILRAELGDLEVLQTTAPRHATELARGALRRGVELVIAVGGDGTIHEVVNGFFDDKGAPLPGTLGVLPFGTGGDFRKTAHLESDVTAAAKTFKAGTKRSVDVGRLEYSVGAEKKTAYFINIASFGIGGLVDKIVNESSKALGGKLSFMLATARAAMRYKNQRVRMTFDGAGDPLELRVQNVAVANGQFFGGGMRIAPGAELDDGWFDVVAVGDFGAFEMLRNLGKVYKGTHLGHAKVTHRRARRVDAEPVDPADEVLLDVDGEPLGSLPATFTLIPRALSIMVPQV